ncbi:MAG: cbb3-type cytochrome c oxidase N-terminal domain-containing protein [Vicinamibacterales bacterium]|jgi:cytochrome c oxidase cbb3-type subunit III
MSRQGEDSKRDALLDHEADGIREFDNALPRWWLYGFYFTIGFAVVYMLNYHVLAQPLFGKAGMVAEYNAEIEAAGKIASAAPSHTAHDVAPLTDADSLAKGRAVFESVDNVCASCHRPDLGGMVGPNLTDEYWLHGCSVHEIAESIKTGYPLKGMMPFGTGKPLTDDQVVQVASYVVSKRGTTPASPKPIDPERDKICR